MNFQDFVRSHGIIPPSVLIPGKWQRCGTLSHPRKKNASIKLSEDGGMGWIQDFASMSSPVAWRPENESRPTQIDYAEIASKASIRRREMIQAAREAANYFAKCQPMTTMHPYLSAKGLSAVGTHGLRVDKDGWLVIPMLLRGSIISVQRIDPNGSKLFWSGAATASSSYTISRTKAEVTLLCEGLATGLTLFTAVANSRVIVAFNAGNLPKVAEAMRPVGLTAVCADNDHKTLERIGKNPGLDAARLASESWGCGLAVAPCEEGTDFDDWRQELMKLERQENMFRSGRKWSPEQMLTHANSKIRDVVMRAVKYVAPKSHAEKA